MLKRLQRTFTTSKYFFDQKYQNILIESEDRMGSLHDVSGIFSEHNVNMVYVKSHFSNVWTKNKKFCLDVSIEKQSEQTLNKLQQKFTEISKSFKVQSAIKVPWFPRNLYEMNLIGQKLQTVKQEANKDHLQFSDPYYRKRRDIIANVALQYKMGQPIPDIEYTKQQTELWRRINQKLSPLHKRGMSRRFLHQMQKLQKQFMFTKRIPQLNELNSYLKNKTGFQIKPTHGILSQRQFLNSFAFKIFCCTQYIRHTKTPDYTPQPDIVHEILGHVPMFADPDVAELSHQLGLLSLGATDEQIAQLGSIYWFTLEFGACLEDGERKGYGAGVASSIQQITNMLDPNAKFSVFNPFADAKAKFPIQTVQEVYRLTETFDKSLRDLENFGKTIMKPVATTFNFGNQTIEYDRNIEAIDIGDIPIQFM